MSLDASAAAAEYSGGTWRSRDLPPVWDGVSPETRWRLVRREITMWAADTETPANRQGVRVWRQLQGRAKELAEPLSDSTLMSSGGLLAVLTHFDTLYHGALQLTAEVDFEQALFAGHRRHDESFLQFLSRKQLEFTRYEATLTLGEELPSHLRGKLLLRQARLSTAQSQRILQWLAGSREETVVRQALAKLDTDVDLTNAMTGQAAAPKSMWEAEAESSVKEEYADPSVYVEVAPMEDLVLAEFYAVDHDVGLDSDDENWIWIHEGDEGELDEDELCQQLATFSAVHKAKLEHRKARGWGSPVGLGDFKGKGKGKGLWTRFGAKGKDNDKGGKGKGFGKGFGKSGSAWQARDQRRQNMRRVPLNSLYQRVRCFRCGQMGHMAKNCSQPPGNPTQSGVKPSYFTLDFVTLPIPSESSMSSTGHVFGSYYSEAAGHALVDTGAVHALIGLDHFLDLDRKLAECGLGVVEVTAPTHVAGVGGQTKTIAGVRVPVAFAHLPGILSMVVVPWAIPALLPLPAMAALNAVIDTKNAWITWPHGRSVLKRMWSGHLGLALTEGLGSFSAMHPEGPIFQRGIGHEKLVQRLRECGCKPTSTSDGHPVGPIAGVVRDAILETALGPNGADLTRCEARAGGEVRTQSSIKRVHSSGPGQHGIMEEIGTSPALGTDHRARASSGAGAAHFGGSPRQTCDRRIKPEPSPCFRSLGSGVVEGAAHSVREHATSESQGMFSSKLVTQGEQALKMVGMQELPSSISKAGARDDVSQRLEPEESGGLTSGRGLQTRRWTRSHVSEGSESLCVSDQCGSLCVHGQHGSTGSESLCVHASHGSKGSGLLCVHGQKAKGQKAEGSGVQVESKGEVALDCLALAEFMAEELVLPRPEERMLLDSAYLRLVPGNKVSARAEHIGQLQEGQCRYVGFTQEGETIIDALTQPAVEWHGVAFRVKDTTSLSPSSPPTRSEVLEIWRLIECQEIVRYPVQAGIVVVHGPQPNLQVQDTLLNSDTLPFRVSVIRGSDGSVSVSHDVWIAKGRRKRAQSLPQGSEVLCTVFVNTSGDAEQWHQKLAESQPQCLSTTIGAHLDLLVEMVPLRYVESPPEELSSEIATWSWTELLQEVYKRLQQCPFERATGRTNVTDGDYNSPLLSVTLGLATSRGATVTKATTTWQEMIPLLHELAQRRSCDMQHPYLAITVSCGRASLHVDKNWGPSSLLALGPFTHGGGLRLAPGIAKTQVLQVKHQWKQFDAGVPHEVQQYDGIRYSVALYVPGRPHLLLPAHVSALRGHGFPVDWWLHSMAWRDGLPAEWTARHIMEASQVATSYPELDTIPEDEVLADVDQETPASASAALDEVAATPEDGDGAHVVGHDLEQEQSSSDGVEMEVPSKAQRSAILRMHTNLGHPPIATLLRAMRVAGVRPGIRLWTKRHFTCPACAAWRPSPQRRPAMLPRAYDFCVVVGIDVIHVAIGDHASKSYLNVVDWGTRFVQAVRLECPHDAPTSRACLQAYMVGWAKIFGHPEVIITDQGNEFRDVFAEALTAEGVFLVTINARAPWEQGITERHGAAIKEQARMAAAMTDVLTDEDVDELVAAACLSHNQYYDRSGYTPSQRVFGQLPRFPSDLVSDQQLDSDVLALGTKRQFQKSQELRLAARQAFF
eukprot:6490405-Amphidinium_carterae.1